MVTGMPPFYEKNAFALREAVCKGDYLKVSQEFNN